MTVLEIIGLIVYFGAGVSGLAWLFDKGTEPQRSVLWVGPFMATLLLFIFSLVILGMVAAHS